MPVPKIPLKLIGQLERYHLFWWSWQLKKRSVLTSWNREKNAIFVHIPKTAGTTILDMLGADHVFDTHAPALTYRLADAPFFQGAFKFSIVRNPWDRFASSFHFMKDGTDWQMQKDWSARHIGNLDFDEFVWKLRNPLFRQEILSERFFWPQSFWLNDRSNRSLVDAVFRFEDVERSLTEICRRLDIPAPDMVPTHRKSARPHFRDLYDKASADIIGNIYAADIKALNYTFDGSTN